MNLNVTYASDDAKHVLILANPKSGARSGQPTIDSLQELLSQCGLESTTTTDMDEVAELSSQLHRRRALRAVVAAGGDGTIGLVANRTQPGIPITVLPLGTENLLSKYLGIKTDAQSVCQLISTGAVVSLDAGRVGDRLFLLMVGCGFDADVVRRVHNERQGHIHHLSYAKPILDSIRNYEYPELRVSFDGGESISARWAFVFNLPCYALGLPIAPGATATDGWLDACTFKEGSWWNALMYLGGVMLGQHHGWDDCENRLVHRVRVESDERVPFEVDGDPGGFLPVEIEIVPDRLTLMVPEAWVASQGPAIVQRTA